MAKYMIEVFHKEGLHQSLLRDIDNDYENTMLTILNTINNIDVPITAICKSESRSNAFRVPGNTAFCEKKFGLALSFYNMAIMHAPCNSYSLLQAYNNRSALLFKLGKLDECIRDINTCLKMSPPQDLRKKMFDRKNECIASCRHNTTNSVPDLVNEKYFELKGNTHTNIPCALDAVKIVGNKVVADRDINVGEVISVETAYVSVLKNTEVPICCHYCHKFSYNMIPCKTCCFAMYCADDCLQKSWNQVHKLECEVYRVGNMNNIKFRLSVQAVLKAIISSGGVSQLMSSVMEAKKTNDYIDEPYKKVAYLNLCKMPIYEQLCRRGKLFECAVNAAIIVQKLSRLSSLMPNKKEKKKMMVFLGKQIMFHSEKSTHLVISGATIIKDKDVDNLNLNTGKAVGLFPFTSMVQHSCFPNVESYGYGNKKVLVAVDNIRKGTELTMPYLRNFIIDTTRDRKRLLYINYGFVCKCQACSENWMIDDFNTVKKLPKPKLDFLRKIGSIEKFLSDINETHGKGALLHYPTACEGLALFSEYPKSVYYKFFLNAFQSCYHIFQAHTARQYIEGHVDAFINSNA